MKTCVMLYNLVNYCLRKSLVQKQEQQVQRTGGLCKMRKSLIAKKKKDILFLLVEEKKTSIKVNPGLKKKIQINPLDIKHSKYFTFTWQFIIFMIVCFCYVCVYVCVSVCIYERKIKKKGENKLLKYECSYFLVNTSVCFGQEIILQSFYV